MNVCEKVGTRWHRTLHARQEEKAPFPLSHFRQMHLGLWYAVKFESLRLWDQISDRIDFSDSYTPSPGGVWVINQCIKVARARPNAKMTISVQAIHQSVGVKLPLWLVGSWDRWLLGHDSTLNSGHIFFISTHVWEDLHCWMANIIRVLLNGGAHWLLKEWKGKSYWICKFQCWDRA